MELWVEMLIWESMSRSEARWWSVLTWSASLISKLLTYFWLNLRNYKLLLAQVTTEMMRLDNALRKPREALWNDLKGTRILQKFLYKLKAAHSSEHKSLTIWVQTHYLSTLERAWPEESPVQSLLTKAAGQNLLPCTQQGGCQELALLGWKDLVGRLTQAEAKPSQIFSCEPETPGYRRVLKAA